MMGTATQEGASVWAVDAGGPGRGGFYNGGDGLLGTLGSSGAQGSGGLGGNGALDSGLAAATDRRTGVFTNRGIVARVRGGDLSGLGAGSSSRGGRAPIYEDGGQSATSDNLGVAGGGSTLMTAQRGGRQSPICGGDVRLRSVGARCTSSHSARGSSCDSIRDMGGGALQACSVAPFRSPACGFDAQDRRVGALGGNLLRGNILAAGGGALCGVEALAAPTMAEVAASRHAPAATSASVDVVASPEAAPS